MHTTVRKVSIGLNQVLYLNPFFKANCQNEKPASCIFKLLAVEYAPTKIKKRNYV